MNESMNACTHPKITELDGHVFCAACEPVERLDIVETAGVIRLELKKAFPGTKFSVTTSRYSMGRSDRCWWSGGSRRGVTPTYLKTLAT